MPEYLAPGVYVEETSFRAKTIEGVSTSTAGFVGPTRFGPVAGEPELLTNFADFERIYGGLDPLVYDGQSQPNFLAHAVRAFFEEGGRRLYVARAFEASTDSGDADHARAAIDGGAIKLGARHPGASGEVTVAFTVRTSQNILTVDGSRASLPGARPYDVVLVEDASPPIGSTSSLFWLEPTTNGAESPFRLRRGSDDVELTPGLNDVRIVTVTVTVGPMGRFDQEQTWDDLATHPQHANSLARQFAKVPPSRRIELFVPLIVETSSQDGAEILSTLVDAIHNPSSPPTANPLDPDASQEERTLRVTLDNGGDGQQPSPNSYAGSEDDQGRKSGLKALEDIEDISIVAAPGSTYGYADTAQQQNVHAITGSVISHCERMQYRIGVLDSPGGQLVSGVRRFRGRVDSKYAALYYPWIRILDPITEAELNVPPSGFVAGIYARNDIVHGVHKAPANEVVRLAIGFETLLNKAQQEVLNPEGVNCFRFFEGRGFRLWGARTITSDPEWKYVNLRRYFAFLERSIEKATQFAVFESNSETLWANLRRMVEDFLFNEFRSGHLMGAKPEEAFFVRCDRSTMTQNDLDNGRLVCLIGVAPVRPAEFVIFRIGQFTADARQ